MSRAEATLAACAVAGLLVATPASPEAPDHRPLDVVSGEIEVRLAEIEVRVTDRQGEPVAGFGRDDFEILQAGRPVAVTHFQAVTGGRAVRGGEDLAAAGEAPGPAVAAEAPVEAPEPASRLHLVLYVDRSYLEPGDLAGVRTALKTFLRQALSPRDRVMLVSATTTSMERVQGFTTVPELVIAQLDGIRERPGGGRFPRAYQSILTEGRRISLEGRDDTNARDPRLVARGYLGRIQAFSAQIQGELQRTAAQLLQLTRTLAGLPGRRAVVYVGGRVPALYGRRLFDAWDEAFGRNTRLEAPSRPSAGEPGDPRAAALDPGFDTLAAEGSSFEIDASRLVQEVAREASAHGIVFHTLDASGLRGASSLFLTSGDVTLGPRGSTPGSAGDSMGSLRDLARKTGGLAFSGSRDFEGALARIGSDLGTYYTLGFEPLAAAKGDRSRIEVRLREEHRGGRHRGGGRLRVRHRPLLAFKDRDTLAAERTQAALLLEEMENPLAIEVAPGEARPAKKGAWTVPVSVSVPLARLALVADGRVHAGRLSIYATSGGIDHVGSVVKAVVPVRIANQDLLTSLGRRVAFQMELILPGPERIAVTVRDDFRPLWSTATAAFDGGAAAAPPGSDPGSE